MVEGAGVAAGVLVAFVEVDVISRSSTTAGCPDLRRERLLFDFTVETVSSPPEVCSPSVFSIRSFRRRKRSWRAACLSPPPTVLFLPNFPGELGDATPNRDGSRGSAPPVNLCMAIIRAAALLDRNRPCKCLDCKACSVGMGVGGEVPGYPKGEMGGIGATIGWDIWSCAK